MHPHQQPGPGALAIIAEFQRVYLLSPLSPKIAAPYDNSAEQGVYIQNPWPINVTGIGPAKSSAKKAHQLLSGPAAGNDYLHWGLARLNETYFHGQCDAFASVVTSLLVAQGGRFPGGALVEICTVVKTPVSGHTFVLVNRDQNGALANSASWGADAVIIDPWYALQVGCPAAFSPLDAHGAGFIAWALQLKGFKAAAAGVFTVGNHPSVKLPQKYR
ncbi:hypothetical protein GCM10023085_67120 [Actinomadura viridis]|uniref:Uncharacterized protein n=1 Tax=Actinomadura viridis TaxID=58110 RepID=A0A931GT34_9ACTN|nr:hypothetical protein [Actinomadura viridis]MBG6091534.1 hypothetical protein [Actinomadura viridis]